MGFSSALVVANPIAGRGRGEAVGRMVAEGLAARGIAAELYLTRERGDGVARVRRLRAGVDLVVAVGGDGTLREVLEGLPDPALPVGLVPVGTGNVMSQELGLPRDPRSALDVILAGKVRPLDVGRVNGRLCCFVTGVGLDGMVVREVERRRQGSITRWSYIAALLRVLRGFRPPQLMVTIDDAEPVAAGFVLITNRTRYAGLFRLSTGRRSADRGFDVYLFPDARRRAIALAALRGVVGHVAPAGCEVRPARRVRVVAARPVPYEVDGDYAGETPVEFGVEKKRYLVLGRAQGRGAARSVMAALAQT